MKLHEAFGHKFWKVARETPFYEDLFCELIPHNSVPDLQEILSKLQEYFISHNSASNLQEPCEPTSNKALVLQRSLHKLFRWLAPFAKAVLPNGSKPRYFARHLYYKVENKN